MSGEGGLVTAAPSAAVTIAASARPCATMTRTRVPAQRRFTVTPDSSACSCAVAHAAANAAVSTGSVGIGRSVPARRCTAPRSRAYVRPDFCALRVKLRPSGTGSPLRRKSQSTSAGRVDAATDPLPVWFVTDRHTECASPSPTAWNDSAPVQRMSRPRVSNSNASSSSEVVVSDARCVLDERRLRREVEVLPRPMRAESTIVRATSYVLPKTAEMCNAMSGLPLSSMTTWLPGSAGASRFSA